MTHTQDNQSELIALAELAGIHSSPAVFQVLMELLALQVCPEDIYTLLRQISSVAPQKKKPTPLSKPV